MAERAQIRKQTTKQQLIQKNEAEKLLMDEKRKEALKDSLKLLDVFVNNRHMQMLTPAKANDLYYCNVEQFQSTKSNPVKNIRVYGIHKIMFNQEEDNFEKLVSLYSAMYDNGSILAMIIQGNGNSNAIYFCVNSETKADESYDLLMNNFKGQFPGSEINQLNPTDISKLLASFSTDITNHKVSMADHYTVKSLSLIPGRREEEIQKGRILTSQGIEKFIDTMNGKNYTLIMIAQPITGEVMDLTKGGFEDIYTSLSPYAKEQASYSQSESDSMSYTVSQGISHSTGNSISNSYGTSHNTSIANGRGRNSGFSSSWEGLGFSNGSSFSTTYANSDGSSSTISNGSTSSDGTNAGESTSKSQSHSTSKSITVTKDNKAVTDMMEKVEVMIQRIDQAKLFGMWNAACYIIGENKSTTSIAASTLLSLLSGENKGATQAYINEWDQSTINERNQILKYIGNLYHPEINLQLFKEDENGNRMPLVDDEGNPIVPQRVTPALMISGRELPVMFNLPGRSIQGVVVDSMAEFGRNISDTWISHIPSHRRIPFGEIYHMGIPDKGQVMLDMNTFASHSFICGAAGSGKSNTTFNLLYEFYQRKVPFLVIEPAKGEYKTEFEAIPKINIFTADGRNGYRRLQMNPFEFPARIDIRQHLDMLTSTISACWPLFGACPGILKQAFEKVYIDHGWDLDYSKRVLNKGSKFPTFKDLEKALNEVIEASPYPKSTQGEYKGALLNRVSSLNNGFEGPIFGNAYGVSDQKLFNENTIIDLSSIGSDETRSLIMGLLIIRLREYRQSSYVPNSSLKHITVLEEAHNLLKRCSQDTSVDSGNMQGQSVKMLCNCITEMRSYGEGFMIIDQSPSAIDENAIKNTAIKIVMRLPSKDDCEAMGAALSLDDEQIKEISRFKVGIAAIYHVGWENTVLAKMGNIWNKTKMLGTVTKIPYDPNSYIRVKGYICQYLYHRIISQDVDDLENDLYDEIDILCTKGRPNELPYDKIEEIKTELRPFFEDCHDELRTSNYKQLTYALRGLLFNFLHLNSIFKIYPLTNVDKKFDLMAKDDKKACKKVITWAREIKKLLGQYVVMPEKAETETWGRDPLKAQYYDEIFGLIYLHFQEIQSIEQGNWSYTNFISVLKTNGITK